LQSRSPSSLQEALGGVLFVDEAYSLAPENSDQDFGHEAIETLLKLMEDNREDLVVIAAGYSERMHLFIESNPGLRSRFTRFIDFPDYTPEELVKILIGFADESGYRLSSEALAAAARLLTCTNRDTPAASQASTMRAVAVTLPVWKSSARRAFVTPARW
jgi:SpoVK/Ycf46/Vps4 family AAA+-type ATPase